MKGGLGKIIKFNGPIIVVSNYDNVSDDVIISRLICVKADEAILQKEICPAPKEEVQSEEEDVQTISSGSIAFSQKGKFAEGNTFSQETNQVFHDILFEVEGAFDENIF